MDIYEFLEKKQKQLRDDYADYIDKLDDRITYDPEERHFFRTVEMPWIEAQLDLIDELQNL